MNNKNSNKKDNNINNNKIIKSNKTVVNNIEILLRLYCFETEIKESISNYEKIKTPPSGSLIDKDFISNYKKFLDYKSFVKMISSNNQILNCIKDENGIISHDNLQKNNNLLNIMNQLKNLNQHLIDKINKIDIKNSKCKEKSYAAKPKLLEGIKLTFIEDFEFINHVILDLICSQFSFNMNTDYCKIVMGKEYIYFHIFINQNNSNPLVISEIGKIDTKNNVTVKYLLNFNPNFGNNVFHHILEQGTDNIVNIFKSQGEKEYIYVFGNDKIKYFKIGKDYVIAPNNKEDEKKDKKKNVFIGDQKFKKNEILQKLTYLYCYYSDIYRRIYSVEKKDNNNILSKVYLVNYKSLRDIKIELDYDALKNIFDNNEDIQKIIMEPFLHLIDYDEIIKLLPKNCIEKYKKKKINSNKNLRIEPDICAKDIPMNNEKIMHFNQFVLLDKLLFNFFFPNSKVANQIEVESYVTEGKGKIIINLPKYLNEKTLITLIGFLELDTNIFITSHILVFFKISDQKNYIENIMNDNLDNYLQSLKEEYTNIKSEGNIIGIIIKNKIEDSVKEIPIGLENIGATCYMNATLQCFMHIKEFVKYFKKDKTKENVILDKNTLSYSFKLLIDNICPDNKYIKKKSYYAPQEFKKKISKMNPLFEGIAANDSKDLINFIVMTLHEELNQANDMNISNEILDQSNKEVMFNVFVNDFKQRYNSLSSKLFYGINYNITKCSQCLTQLYNYQIYFFLLFPLEEVRKFCFQNNNNKQLPQFNQNTNNQINQINNTNQINQFPHNNNQFSQYDPNNFNQFNQFIPNQINSNNNQFYPSNQNVNMQFNHLAQNNAIQFNPIFQNNNIQFNQNNNMQINQVSQNNNLQFNQFNQINNNQINQVNNNQFGQINNNQFNQINNNQINQVNNNQFGQVNNNQFGQVNNNQFNQINQINNNQFGQINNNQINQINNNNNQINQINNNQINQINNNQINQINNNNNTTNNNINNNDKNVVDIYQCFDFDRRTSLMSGDNAMFCNKCQKSTDCYISTYLVTCPNILIIILNRGKGKQFDVKLNFYEDLNLSKYIEKQETGVNYKLIGVITHLGESGMSGHFIAFCKDYSDNLWYKFNDAIVSEVEDFKKEVIDFGMPYLLFYQKVGK